MTLFTEDFINDIHEQLFEAQYPLLSELPLYKIDFEQEILSIVRFYVLPVLCYHFMGQSEDYLHGTFTAHNLKKGEVMECESIPSPFALNIIVPLNQQGTDFQGGGFSFNRYILFQYSYRYS